jgi:hypothetical protein
MIADLKLTSLAALHPDCVRVFERSRSLDPLDAVSLEQETQRLVMIR